MKEMKSVLKHLNKNEVNLSSERVELGLAQDIVSQFRSLKQSSVKASDVQVEIGRLHDKLYDALSIQESELKSAEELKSKTDKLLKELGLSSKDVQGYKQLREEIEIAKEAIKSNKRTINALK